MGRCERPVGGGEVERVREEDAGHPRDVVVCGARWPGGLHSGDHKCCPDRGWKDEFNESKSIEWAEENAPERKILRDKFWWENDDQIYARSSPTKKMIQYFRFSLTIEFPSLDHTSCRIPKMKANILGSRRGVEGDTVRSASLRGTPRSHVFRGGLTPHLHYTRRTHIIPRWTYFWRAGAGPHQISFCGVALCQRTKPHQAFGSLPTHPHIEASIRHWGRVPAALRSLKTCFPPPLRRDRRSRMARPQSKKCKPKEMQTETRSKAGEKKTRGKLKRDELKRDRPQRAKFVFFQIVCFFFLALDQRASPVKPVMVPSGSCGNQCTLAPLLRMKTPGASGLLAPQYTRSAVARGGPGQQASLVEVLFFTGDFKCIQR